MRPVRKEQRPGEQHAVNGARRADRDALTYVDRAKSNGSSETAMTDSARADAADEVVLQKRRRAPSPLEVDAEHPEREHVEQDVRERRRRVHEEIRPDLPDVAVLNDGGGRQAEQRDDGRRLERAWRQRPPTLAMMRPANRRCDRARAERVLHRRLTRIRHARMLPDTARPESAASASSAARRRRTRLSISLKIRRVASTAPNARYSARRRRGASGRAR